jgi:pimeloyl-ACP methyl ester carboxylesterase
MSTTYRIPGLRITDHEFTVPLNHLTPDGRTITIFAREVTAAGGTDRPFLLFLQGGPGSEAPRPSGVTGGWLGRALEDYRVLLLDQRGTGRSSPIGSLPGMTHAEQADYLTLFRADSIVRDAEIVRTELSVHRWSVLGQSFGGFCLMTYLSLFPDALREGFFTGGLAPIGRHIDDIYAKTYARVLDRCERFYARYPANRQRVLALLETIESTNVTLPSGDRLTARLLRQCGHMLGMSDGAERLHYLLELPFDSPAFLHDIDRASTFARNPLYAIVHEACYADGCVTDWSAERVQPHAYAEQPELFTGEHVFPWQFEDIGLLRPLKEAASIVARHDWPRLYDSDVLARNEVPCAAAVYYSDMYVESTLSMETASHVQSLKPWITNEFEHDALRLHGDRILDRLIKLARDEA